MAPLKSILVMADRSADAQVALQKAFVIARHFDAQIELFACDAEQPWVARSPGRAAEGAHAAAARSVETRRFLDALRGMIVVDDLQIRAGEDCDGPLHEGLPRRVRAAGHHLVVKRLPAREGRRRPALSAADWQVIRACPVPFQATLELGVCAMIFATAVGIPVGVLAAVKRGSIFDHTAVGLALTGYSMMRRAINALYLVR